MRISLIVLEPNPTHSLPVQKSPTVNQTKPNWLVLGMRKPFGSLSTIFFPFRFFLWDLCGLFFVVWVKTRRSAKPNNFDPVLAFRHRCFSPTRTVRSETFPSICELFLQSIAINLGRVIVWREPKLECYLCWPMCLPHASKLNNSFRMDLFTSTISRVVWLICQKSKWLIVMSSSLPTMKSLEMGAWTTWTARLGYCHILQSKIIIHS